MSARWFNPKNGDVFAARYRIEGIVGRGGFGAVYRASDRACFDEVFSLRDGRAKEGVALAGGEKLSDARGKKAFATKPLDRGIPRAFHGACSVRPSSAVSASVRCKQASKNAFRP